MASMELLRRTLGARGWLTDEGHALLVAVSRFTPGTNILAYCAALGWQLGRLAWSARSRSLRHRFRPRCSSPLLSATLVQVDQHPIVRVVIAVALIVATVLVLSGGLEPAASVRQRDERVRTGIIAARRRGSDADAA